MATLLIATTEGAVVRRLPLDPRRAYSLGRSHRCDIALEPGSISRRHALLFRHAGTWWVADSGSAKGIRTEEGPTRLAPLTLERWVSIGPLVCWLLASTVKLDDPDAPADDPVALNQEFRSTLEVADSVDLDSESAPDAEGESDFILLEPIAGGAPRLLHLDGVDHVTIGSDPSCAVRLPPSDLVQPLHAVAYREPRTWVIIGAGGAVTSGGQRFLRKRIERVVPVEFAGYRVRLVTAEAADVNHDGSTIAPPRPHVPQAESPTKQADLYADGSTSVFLQPSMMRRFAPKSGESPLL